MQNQFEVFFMFGQGISCNDAKSIIENGGQLVDVRSPMEHQQFAIPGSINIPLQHLGMANEHLDPAKPVILYCRSGARSGQAQMYLNQMGYSETYNLGSVNSYFTC